MNCFKDNSQKRRIQVALEVPGAEPMFDVFVSLAFLSLVTAPVLIALRPHHK